MATAGRFVALLVSFLLGFAVQRLLDAGELKTLVPHGVGNCSLITAPQMGLHAGIEDLTLHPTKGFVLGGADNRGWLKSGSNLRDGIAEQKLQGRIVKLNLAQAILNPLNTILEYLPLKGFPHHDFHPHGIWLSGDLLYVVNHRRDADSIELFYVEEAHLNFVRSFTHSSFRALNDVAVASDGSLLVSNFLYYAPHTFMNQVETIGKRPWSYLLRCVEQKNGTVDCQVALSGLYMVNGVAVKGDRVYVAETLAKRVGEYDFMPQDGCLKLVRFIDFDSGVDNLELSGDKLVVASHPQLFHFVFYSENHAFPSPSQVDVIDLLDPSSQPSNILLSNGTEMSGSSVAALYAGHVVVGSVHDDGLLLCRLS